MPTWSPYQETAFDFIANGAGNAIVKAVAGSGKTTTGVEMVKRIPAGKSHIFLAFNKSIATELSSRGINGRTFHSLCYSPVLRAKDVKTVTTDKLRRGVDENIGDAEARLYGSFIVRLVGLARNAGVGVLSPDEPETWEALAEHHDLELDDEAAKPARAIELARKLLAWSNSADALDFDDLLYLAVKDGISLPKFDYVFVDEAQDTNAIQRAILRKLMKPASRLIAVGDPAQAIYGFRGADSDSMGLIKDEFACTELPLTVTYRCPTSVVEFAREWVDHIEPAPGAAEGTVTELGESWKPAQFQADDLIVCRTTKPLIALCYSLIRAKVPARMMGREIGAGLKSLVTRMNAKGIDALVEKLSIYTAREVEKHIAKRQQAKAEAVQDKTDAIFCLIEGLYETERTVPALLAVIDSLFDEAAGQCVLATIHKAKGLEANRVYWLNSSQCPAKWATQPWQQQQERNLCYVAVTRAKSELLLIEERKERNR
jgi:superfamily I DNA/RNA helicase